MSFIIVYYDPNKQTQRTNQQQQTHLLDESGKTCLHEHIQITMELE